MKNKTTELSVTLRMFKWKSYFKWKTCLKGKSSVKWKSYFCEHCALCPNSADLYADLQTCWATEKLPKYKYQF